jgi:cysteine desulfurase / selenocysteine lyase
MLPHRIYLDNAATTFPKPEAVYRAMDSFMRTAAANPGRSGHGMALQADVVVARARQALARLLNAPAPERIVWTANCTEALNLALKGLLRPGDTVVTTALEHNAVARPLRALERQRGIRLVRVPCPGGVPDLDALLEAVRPGTRLVVMVHVSNVSGAALPVAEVGERCRQVGARFLVDAAQSAGSLPLDVRAMGIDLLAVPGHKGLFGPPGTGALYVGEGVELEPLKEGGTGSASERDEQPAELPQRYESGTLNSVGIAGLGAGVEWLLETGREAVRRRETALTERLWNGLAELPGVTLYGPPADGRDDARGAAMSLNLEGWDPTDAAQVLDESFGIQCRPGLHCAPWAHRSLGTFPAGTLRLSPGYFNTEEEMDAAVGAVRELLEASPVSIP